MKFSTLITIEIGSKIYLEKSDFCSYGPPINESGLNHGICPGSWKLPVRLTRSGFWSSGAR